MNLKISKALKKRITLTTFALGDIDGEEEFVLSPEIDNGQSKDNYIRQTYLPEEKQIYRSFIRKNIPIDRADILFRKGDFRVRPLK